MQIQLSDNLLCETNYKELPLKGKWKWDSGQPFLFDIKSDMQEGVVLPENSGFQAISGHTKDLLEEGTLSLEERPSRSL